ncbi:uncharacterized protein BDW43DRAFT_258163 [Aspergillus alliaceus]|uniref:uncharacterized protein n=1 Tax=Petromyces alliaceus TaxID=209559 RepID=UPI0012A76D36|nr:uncharacterized protein BDW43DRAFT_258163 [Aspergillus alliaceus]KAB8239462.1 hypothetical protein BDW43DRAFT_258163 [Aspergillus alliaceus]
MTRATKLVSNKSRWREGMTMERPATRPIAMELRPGLTERRMEIALSPRHEGLDPKIWFRLDGTTRLGALNCRPRGPFKILSLTTGATDESRSASTLAGVALLLLVVLDLYYVAPSDLSCG